MADLDKLMWDTEKQRWLTEVAKQVLAAARWKRLSTMMSRNPEERRASEAGGASSDRGEGGDVESSAEGAGGYNLSLDDFLQVLTAAVLEKERECRREEFCRERAAASKAGFQTLEVEDLRELYNHFAGSQMEWSKSSLGKMVMLLRLFGCRDLNDHEMFELAEITKDRVHRPEGKVRFEEFLQWMHGIFAKGIGGFQITNRQRPTWDRLRHRSGFTATIVRDGMGCLNAASPRASHVYSPGHASPGGDKEQPKKQEQLLAWAMPENQRSPDAIMERWKRASTVLGKVSCLGREVVLREQQLERERSGNMAAPPQLLRKRSSRPENDGNFKGGDEGKPPQQGPRHRLASDGVRGGDRAPSPGPGSPRSRPQRPNPINADGSENVADTTNAPLQRRSMCASGGSNIRHAAHKMLVSQTSHSGDHSPSHLLGGNPSSALAHRTTLPRRFNSSYDTITETESSR
jgi:hypothetical protein